MREILVIESRVRAVQRRSPLRLVNICALATPVSTSSVRTGKFADMVILSDNIFDLKPEATRNMKVDTTIVGDKGCKGA